MISGFHTIYFFSFYSRRPECLTIGHNFIISWNVLFMARSWGFFMKTSLNSTRCWICWFFLNIIGKVSFCNVFIFFNCLIIKNLLVSWFLTSYFFYLCFAFWKFIKFFQTFQKLVTLFLRHSCWWQIFIETFLTLYKNLTFFSWFFTRNSI